MSLGEDRHSPLYRPGQAFREDPGRLPAVATIFLAVGAVEIRLASVSDGWAGAVGSLLFLLGMVVGGGAYTAIQLRAVHRRATARARHDPRAGEDRPT